MDERKITRIYFSPGKTTFQVLDTFTSVFSADVESIDLLQNTLLTDKKMTSDELLIVAIPVFAGRIPAVCVPTLEKLKGEETPAIIIAVYGNRAFEDSLLEMSNLLSKNGFRIIGAGAFIARHSMFPKVAKNRPDIDDNDIIKKFAMQCIDKLEKNNHLANFKIPGNYPYRDGATLPLKPSGNFLCVKCNVCVKICPVDAISEKNPRKTDKEKCITCTACIYHCPHKARSFHGLKYKLVRRTFTKKFSDRKEAEIFL